MKVFVNIQKIHRGGKNGWDRMDGSPGRLRYRVIEVKSNRGIE